MTRDEFAVALLEAGVVEVEPEQGRVCATRGPGGTLLAVPRPVGSNLGGYRVASFRLNGERKQLRLHRLVWIAAKGPPPPGMVVAHKDNDKAHNALGNLYLATSEGNSSDAARDGLYLCGERNPATKLTEEQREAIRAAYRNGGETVRTLAARFGVGKSRVAQIVA